LSEDPAILKVLRKLDPERFKDFAAFTPEQIWQELMKHVITAEEILRMQDEMPIDQETR
jgi:hypothetical protein